MSGLERFDQYTYGRKVHIQNDHKPLATILNKPLSQASRRIQALMMRLHRYEVTFQYVQGSQLFIADTLSRAFLPDPGIDVRVMAINSLLDIPDKTRQHRRSVKQRKKIRFYRHSFNSLTKDGQPGRATSLNPSVCTSTSVTR